MGDDEFNTGAGASLTYPMQCSALRKNGYVMIKERPCKIVEMSTSKTGKHGHAKVHLVTLDIFTGKKLEENCPSTHNMNVPNVVRKDYQLIDVAEDEYEFTLLNENGEDFTHHERDETDLLKEIRERYQNDEELMVSILRACGEEKVVAVKGESKK